MDLFEKLMNVIDNYQDAKNELNHNQGLENQRILERSKEDLKISLDEYIEDRIIEAQKIGII